MGRILPFMFYRTRNATKMLMLARFAKTYYGIPREDPDLVECLLHACPHLLESLKSKLRRMLPPASRGKVSSETRNR